MCFVPPGAAASRTQSPDETALRGLVLGAQPITTKRKPNIAPNSVGGGQGTLVNDPTRMRQQ